MTKKIQSMNTLNAVIIGCLDFCKRHTDLLISFAATVIYYGPSLGSFGLMAGYLYTGDVLGWYLPQLVKVHSLISSFHFTAIDYSLHNGSSDYFLSPAFFFYHPLVMIYGLFAPAKAATLEGAIFFLVLFLAIHSFIACYFSIKLFHRFFFFKPAVARLVAVSFAFSIYTVHALGQPPFLVCASIIPWATYSALSYRESPDIRKLLFACLPIIIGFTGGYMPLGITGIALSALLVAIKIIIVDDQEIAIAERVRGLVIASVPYVCASFITGGYLIAVYSFHLETPSNSFASLNFAAHELADLPQNLLWAIFPSLSRVDSIKENAFSLGIVFTTISILFLLTKNSASTLTHQAWRTFKTFALVSIFPILAIYGNFSVVSDLFFYMIPVIGKMHLYQRFLLPTHLMFSAMIALMLQGVIENRPQLAIRVAVAILGLFTVFTAYFVAFKPVLATEMGLNNAFVFEMFIGFLFACLLLIPGKAYVYTFAIILFLLPHFNAMFDYSNNNTVLSLRTNKIALDNDQISGISSYFKTHSNKRVIKYLDLTPFWNNGSETFPKSFPYFTLNQLKLSSYGGFATSHGARSEYICRMPVAIEASAFATRLDWGLVLNTGADYIVVREVDVKGDVLGPLYEKIDKSMVHHLPNGVVIFQFQVQARKDLSMSTSLFDNGYFRIFPTETTFDNYNNIALKKQTRQSSIGVVKESLLAVDGNTDGDFSHGSVTHSGMDPNAWLDIDLGKNEKIDGVRIWNRTDAAESRLNDYWVFLSNKPFLQSDTPSELQLRPETWSSHQRLSTPMPKSTLVTEGVKARYVRIQLSGTLPLNDSFLSLAEVEVFGSENISDPDALKHANEKPKVQIKAFNTDDASYISMELESSMPVVAQYLFSDNPRLTYYLNGQRASKFELDGLSAIEIPAGLNKIEIRYVHWPLRLFMIIYLLYAVSCLFAILPNSFLNRIKPKFLHRLKKKI
ncbi:MAG: discoidin domain-containing protein [Proteobacteria bacterium]|nr:discoidin domain-containing protein [Pseudomonadota bacterium]MBU1584352.1 discoidin domain-containing protein [Pseudomonadota bacterium]